MKIFRQLWGFWPFSRFTGCRWRCGAVLPTRITQVRFCLGNYIIAKTINKNIINLLLKSIDLQRPQPTNNKTKPKDVHQAHCCYLFYWQAVKTYTVTETYYYRHWKVLYSYCIRKQFYFARMPKTIISITDTITVTNKLQILELKKLPIV